MVLTKNKKSVKDVETIAIISAGLIIFYFIFDVQPLLPVALGVLIAGLISGLFARLVTKLWYKLAALLGFISSRILLTVVYFVVLFPLALLYRLFNKDPLKLKKDSSCSLFLERNHDFTAEELENPW